jgi:hypothetical protein
MRGVRLRVLACLLRGLLTHLLPLLPRMLPLLLRTLPLLLLIHHLLFDRLVVSRCPGGARHLLRRQLP